MKDECSSSVAISTAVEDDVPALVEISRGAFGSEAFWTSQAFKYWMKSNQATNVLAAWHRTKLGRVEPETRSLIVGYIAYRYESPTIAIEQLAVRPEYRRDGIASELIERVARAADIKRYTNIVGTVDEYNLPAQLLLQSLGFTATTVAKGRKPEDHDSYTFEFILPQTAAAR